MDQARYATYAAWKYLDTSPINENSKVHKNNLPHDMVFTKEDDSISDEQFGLLSREYNIHYWDFVGSLIYLLYKKVDLCFAVHNLAKFSSNPDKLHFQGLIYLFRYIRNDKNLGLKYYAKI